LVQRTPNAIGYVEVVYALQNKMAVANIKNAAGAYVTPSTESVTAAAKDLKEIPEDLRFTITNAAGQDAYPIAGITWFLARPSAADADRNKSLKDFLGYVLSDEAQGFAGPLSYSKLPPALLDKSRAMVAKIK